MRHRLLGALYALGLVVALGRAPALAGDAVRSFADGDRNGDGSVDGREAERRALELFSFVDNDKDAYLTRAEYGALVLDGAFGAADADRDGRVSTREFVAVRKREFDAADRDHDGVLSPDEAR